MAFDARAHAAETADDCPPYEFIGLDGEPYHLPHPGTLTTDQATKLNSASHSEDEEQLWELLAELAPEATAAILKMPVRTSAALLEDWQAELGDEAGKSSTGSSAPNRAARRSNPT